MIQQQKKNFNHVFLQKLFGKNLKLPETLCTISRYVNHLNDLLDDINIHKEFITLQLSFADI